MLKRRNKRYSRELKQNVAQDYLSGKGSYETLRKKHEILSTKQIRNWVKLYYSYKELKESHDSRMEIYMTKGRKTTQQERTEIV